MRDREESAVSRRGWRCGCGALWRACRTESGVSLGVIGTAEGKVSDLSHFLQCSRG